MTGRASHDHDDPAAVRTVVVDDATELRALLRTVLARSGRYDVVGEASSGHEAVDVVTRERPALVLLDLSMPGMDGLEALPLLLAAVPAVRVIVLSGYDAHRAARPALDAGAIGYLEKGLAPDELVAAIDRILARHASHTRTTVPRR